MHKILTALNLSEFPNLVHGFTTRELGNDYDRIAQEIKVLPSHIYSLEQIHSAKFVILDKGMDLVHLSEGDALITKRKDVIIGVKTADCVPILVYDENREVVAAIHAGYKGMVAGVIQNTIEQLTEDWGCDVTNLHVAVGPCISVAHYEVGQEVIDMFRQVLGKQAVWQSFAAAKPHLDLRGTVKAIFEALGADLSRYCDINMCTFARNELFFSHRRRPGEGRQFSFIGMVS